MVWVVVVDFFSGVVFTPSTGGTAVVAFAVAFATFFAAFLVAFLTVFLATRLVSFLVAVMLDLFPFMVGQGPGVIPFPRGPALCSGSGREWSRTSGHSVPEDLQRGGDPPGRLLVGWFHHHPTVCELDHAVAAHHPLQSSERDSS